MQLSHQTVAEVTGGLASGIGAYTIDEQAFQDATGFFHRDAFVESRMAFDRADPAHRDARMQFYIAYSYYREGWGRVYNDDTLLEKGSRRWIGRSPPAPDHRLVVADPGLEMHTADELKAELTRGITREPSDFNPLGIFRHRK